MDEGGTRFGAGAGARGSLGATVGSKERSRLEQTSSWTGICFAFPENHILGLFISLENHTLGLLCFSGKSRIQISANKIDKSTFCNNDIVLSEHFVMSVVARPGVTGVISTFRKQEHKDPMWLEGGMV